MTTTASRSVWQRQVRWDLLHWVWSSLAICGRLAKLFQGFWQVWTTFLILYKLGTHQRKTNRKKFWFQGQVRDNKPVRVEGGSHHLWLQPQSSGANKIPASSCTGGCKVSKRPPNVLEAPQVYRLLLRKFDRTGRQAVCFDDFIQCCLVMQVIGYLLGLGFQVFGRFECPD